ncbi:4397_t:CDS:1, partial [Acaulospora colombiana]
MFYEIFCGSAVRIVLVATAMEEVEDLEKCWGENEVCFQGYNMSFDGHACITAIKGREGRLQKEYDKSKRDIEDLIETNSKVRPWKMQEETWFQRVVVGFFQFGMTDGDEKVLYKALRNTGMDKGKARDFAK